MHRLLMIVGIAGLALVACAGEEADVVTTGPALRVTASTTPSTSAPATSIAPGAVAATAPLFDPGDIDTGLQPFIDIAISDLSDRLRVPEEDIELSAAVLVVWPDSALGCPEPGMSYLQMAVDGAVIELSVDRSFYRYHAGGETEPFLCVRPLTEKPARTDARDTGLGFELNVEPAEPVPTESADPPTK